MKTKFNNEKANEIIQERKELGLKTFYETVKLFADYGEEISEAANIYKSLAYLGEDLPSIDNAIMVFDTSIEANNVRYVFEMNALRIETPSFVFETYTDGRQVNCIDNIETIVQTREINKNTKALILAGAGDILADAYEIMHNFSIVVNSFVDELYRKSLTERRPRPLNTGDYE